MKSSINLVFLITLLSTAPSKLQICTLSCARWIEEIQEMLCLQCSHFFLGRKPHWFLITFILCTTKYCSKNYLSTYHLIMCLPQPDSFSEVKSDWVYPSNCLIHSLPILFAQYCVLASRPSKPMVLILPRSKLS
ncbi:hypothetical protein BDZ97DRAFT_1831246 [Flammula alnicola]|nr:hypothetical protein BDZ97DRAFT_1831246 [Flammula alnicola]